MAGVDDEVRAGTVRTSLAPREIAAHETFNDAVLDAEEMELLGCVYIDPPGHDSPAADAITSWRVVDRHAGGPWVPRSPTSCLASGASGNVCAFHKFT
jgi:hypothetical protein